MARHEPRPDRAPRMARSEPPPAPEHAPAVVCAPAATAPGEIDLLLRVLPDIADHEVAGAAVEREPVRVAQPIRPDLGPRAPAGHERVAGPPDPPSARAAARIQPQELPEIGGQALAVAVRVARAAAVS